MAALMPARWQVQIASTVASQSDLLPGSTSHDAASSTSGNVNGSPPTGDLLYSNSPFHFSLYYPSNLQVQTTNQSGTLTVIFQDSTSGEGFEIYVMPYDSAQITESRFKLDEPSGTFVQPTNVIIDGTPATMFFGYNSLMGETREEWFIKSGLLYEVVTYKALDAWLSEIMRTWRFI